MKFTFLGFSQARLIDLGMDDRDALLLRYFIDFKDSGKMTCKTINDEAYYWFAYDGFLEEYPLFNSSKCSLKKDTIYRRLKNMCDIGVLKHTTVRRRGTFSYYAVGEHYLSLISDSKPARRTNKERVYSDSNPKGSDLSPEGTDSDPEGSDSDPKGSDLSPEGTDSNPEQRSINNIHQQYPSTTSVNNIPSSTSSPRKGEEAKQIGISFPEKTDDGDADDINHLFSQSKRKERITPETLALICRLHHTTVSEVIKAVKAVIAQAKENHRSGGEEIRNIIGMLKGRKNGDGHYHSYCFENGVCILAAPEEPQPQASKTETTEEAIDWQARFDALAPNEQAIFRAEAKDSIRSHKANMSPEVYQETLELATLHVFSESQLSAPKPPVRQPAALSKLVTAGVKGIE